MAKIDTLQLDPAKTIDYSVWSIDGFDVYSTHFAHNKQDDDAKIQASGTYNIANSSITARVLVPPDTPLGTDVYFGFWLYSTTDANEYELYFFDNTIEAWHATIDDLFVNTVEHIGGEYFLRIREADGTMFYEYSRDCKIWTELLQQPTPADTTVDVDFVGFNGSETSNRMVLASINTPVKPTVERYYRYTIEKVDGTNTIYSTDNFEITEAINTAGAALSITIPTELTDEDANVIEVALVDENENELITEQGEPILVSTEISFNQLPSLGDGIKLIEYSVNQPLGLTLFNGFALSYTYDSVESTLKVEAVSHGAMLDKSPLVLASGELYAIDLESEIVVDSSHSLYGSADAGTISKVAQTFQTDEDSRLSRIRVYGYLYSATDTQHRLVMRLYEGTPSASGALLSTVYDRYSRTSEGATNIDFSLSPGVNITASTDYYFEIEALPYYSSSPETQVMNLFSSTSASYADGQTYTYTETGGWSAQSTDLTCKVYQYDLSIDANSYSSTDPSTMFSDIVQSATFSGIAIVQDDVQILSTNTDATYTFTFSTHFEAMRKCLELAPANWWFYIDAGSSVVEFKPKPTRVFEYLEQGRVLGFNISRSLANVANLAYVVGGEINGENLLKSSKDVTSIAKYGTWVEARTDNRITNESSAQLLADSIVNEKSEPRFNARVIVPAKHYNIEYYKVGKLVGFVGYNQVINSLNLQIVETVTRKDHKELVLELSPPTPTKRIEDLRRQLLITETQNNPSITSA